MADKLMEKLSGRSPSLHPYVFREAQVTESNEYMLLNLCPVERALEQSLLNAYKYKTKAASFLYAGLCGEKSSLDTT